MAMVRFVRNNVPLTNFYLFYILALCDLRQTRKLIFYLKTVRWRLTEFKKQNKTKRIYISKRKKIDVAHVRLYELNFHFCCVPCPVSSLPYQGIFSSVSMGEFFFLTFVKIPNSGHILTYDKKSHVWMDTKFVLANSFLYKPYSFLFLYLYTRENILKEVEFTLV